ncbi:dihydrofolate reductase [Wolbachia endosymbiont of Cruorifilaria tuberocauda]|uniref:dihydrofolate reductase n=1 Tax=Wolbachia endosymbiont of Cruorifilaria tuberocauda TaxID=1812111 RepID=UPI00158B2E91|nr:dihydrofolate reductase [Wolbachia endosymbiont of Cruorifilaria tuberocauda]QKX01645.1 dihydrofolate reductase [Wolbachia endosymbiont of Cruorifilaria tuberocauda]
MIIIGIMAIDPNGVIGVSNGLPWHYPSELSHFHQTTYKKTIVMGRKTFGTMPQSVLKNRTPIIFSRNKLNPYFSGGIKYTFVSSMQEFFSIKNNSEIYMIGGAQIAHLFLRHGLISTFIITEIHNPCKGDVYFNLMLLNGWSKTILTKTQDYTICRLTR